MRIEFDPSLPISQRHDDIAAALRENQVVVIAGETGSGKTTQLPKIVYELGKRSIAHTQPRRIAARSVAKRIAEECGVELGEEVGYAVRFDNTTSDSTAIQLMTDGLLLAELQNDRLLSRYDAIIIDEAHERSLAIDFLLGYLKQLLPARPDLSVIITSATIDVNRFGELFDAPIIEVSGRTYPVEIRYRPLTESDAGDLLEAVAAAIAELPRDGDILVFLSGERDIRDAAEYLQGKKYAGTEILPLYGRLAAHDQNKVFSTGSGRRIVLATNVAETSITVPGIRFVVDPGLARISRFSARLKVQRLPIEPISQASAAQRAGRCGRVADGICIRLYSEDDFNSRPEFTDPEILRTNLASVLLQMSALRLGKITEFPFLDPPDHRSVNDGMQLLHELGALDGDRLTRQGRTMSQLPVDPRMARMLMAADKLGCLADVLVIVAAMSIQDPRERPLEKQQQADELHRRFVEPDSDFLSYLSLWTYIVEQRRELSHTQFRKACQREFLHYLRIREWQDVHSQLRRTAKDLGFTLDSGASDPDLVHQALLSGLLSHIGLRDAHGREYLGARGARLRVFPGSGLAKKPPEWLMAGELVETTRLWARTAAKIQPEWVEDVGAHLLKHQYSEPRWSKRRGTAVATERATLYGIPVVTDRTVMLSKVDRGLSRELFIRHALVEGQWRTNHAFFQRNRARLDEVTALQDRTRRRDLIVDEETIFEFYQERVGAEVVSIRHFDSWWKRQRRKDDHFLDFDPSQLLQESIGDVDEQFPLQWRTESASYAVDYVFDPASDRDGVIVQLELSDLLDANPDHFVAQVPGHRLELVTELIRSLPKAQRRMFSPASEHAKRLLPNLDRDGSDILHELAALMTASGTDVSSADFNFDAVADHLKVSFEVRDKGEVLARGNDLLELRRELAPALRSGLDDVAASLTSDGWKSWPKVQFGKTIAVDNVVGYPSLVDHATSVGVRVLDSAEEQHVAMVRAQARLISLSTATPVQHLGRQLDVGSKLLLATAPYRDPAAVIEDAWLAALDSLVLARGGPAWDETSFRQLGERVRADAFGVTERIVNSVKTALGKLANIHLDESEAASDVRVQLSWLIYPGFIRDMGAERISRLSVYLEAARNRLTATMTPELDAALDLEKRFHEATVDLSALELLTEPVASVRWSLEELRVSIVAQRLKAAQPVSVKRVTAGLDALDAYLSQRRPTAKSHPRQARHR